MIPEQEVAVTVGSRVQGSDDCKGTVKYVGKVVNTKGQWLGIDWDDPSRGKHNGTHLNVKYFDAKYPTSASFVRPGNVNCGISIIDAIKKRYGLIHESNTGIDIESIAQVQKDMKAKLFEVVGFDKLNKKQSDFTCLQVVLLRDEPVNGAGPLMALAQLCPNIEELDISKTLLNSWDSVEDIVKQLKHLKILNLSDNQLRLPNRPMSESFSTIEHVVLARMEYTWEQCLVCADILLEVQVFQVPYNDITQLQPPPSNVFQQLRLLDLEGNVIKKWPEINKLGNIKTLECLNLSNTSLEDISFPTTDAENNKTSLFPHLSQLILNENNISSWLYLSELDKLNQLSDLKFRENPVLNEESLDTNRQLIIARIQNLNMLNGINILKEERRGAEVDFLKRHGLEYLKLKTEKDRKVFNNLYPSYQDLVQRYGAPEESELKKGPTSIKSGLIELEIYSPDHEGKSFKKKLPYNMSIEKMVGLIQRLFNTGNEMPRLSCVGKKEGHEVSLDNHMKDLNYYSVESGDRISVRW